MHEHYSQEILINEVMSSNSTVISDKNEEFYDWIELYNNSDDVINLEGYCLSDDPNNPTKWQFDEFSFPPNSYILIWASGNDIQAGYLVPDQSHNLLVWFRSEDINIEDGEQISNTNGDINVKKWFSHDRNFFVEQSNELNQPKYKTNKDNLLPFVRFNGTTNFMSGNVQLPVGNEARTLMVVEANADLDNANKNTNNHILHYGGYGLNQAYGMCFQRKSLGAKIGNHYWQNTFYGTASMDSNIHVLTSSYHDNTDNFFVDGKFSGTKKVILNTSRTQKFNIGCRIGSGSEFFGGEISEILVFDSVLSSSNQIRIENYLAAKYGKSLHRFHTNFKLSSDGETLLLTNPYGKLIHQLTIPALPTDVSFGLKGAQQGYFENPTPSTENNQIKGKVLSAPSFSVESGMFTDSISLELKCSEPGSLILYTLDGSTPDSASIDGYTFPVKYDYTSCNQGELINRKSRTYIYNNPLKIKPRNNIANDISNITASFRLWTQPEELVPKATVVRARTWKPGTIPSRTITKTFFHDSIKPDKYSLPIVSIVTDDSNLFDYNTGIYVPGVCFDQTCTLEQPSANFNQDSWERPASFEFFDSQGQSKFRQDVGIRIHGNNSTNWSRKSLQLNARKKYDEESLFNFEFFPGLHQKYAVGGNKINTFNTFLIRNSGNRWLSNLFHDAMVHKLVRHIDIMDIQESNLIVHYLNGEYWGIMNLRENYSNDYFASHYNMNPEDVIIGNARTATISSGYEYEYKEYIEMEQFVENNSLSIQENFDYLQTQMDVENYLNHFMIQIYVNNRDFLGNNRKFWKKRTISYSPEAPYGQDGRWRWIFYDLDQSFEMPENNRLASTLSGDLKSALILRKLLEREDIRYDFINRFCDHMNTTFKAKRVEVVFDSLAKEMEHDFPGHIKRWGIRNEDQNKSEIINFAINRPYYMRQHLQKWFNLNDTIHVKLESNEKEGIIRINSTSVSGSLPGLDNPGHPYPWNGIYFSKVPLRFEALPEPGYVFSHWEGASNARETSITIIPSNDVFLKAHFIPQSESDNYVLHYWHFNDLDGKYTTIKADYSVSPEAYITYEGPGTGYMDERSQSISDPVSNYNLKFDVRPDVGAVLRVRNPTYQRELLIKAPSENFNQISVSFATTRTTNGPSHQVFYYSVDGGEKWDMFENAYPVTFINSSVSDFGYVHKTFNLTAIENVANNPNLMFKIVFTGQGVNNESGNARFDNISVDGQLISKESFIIDKDPDDKGIVKLYPSPAYDFFNVEIHITEPDKIEVSLVDILGRTVVKSPVPLNNPGLYKAQIDISHLSSGIYWIVISSLKKGKCYNFSKKIVVQ